MCVCKGKCKCNITTTTKGDKGDVGALGLSVGTLNKVAKWTPNGTTLGDSNITDNGTTVSIGTSTQATVSLTGVITVPNVTPSTSKDTGAIITEGGIGVELSVFAGTIMGAGVGSAASPAFQTPALHGIYQSSATELGIATAGVFRGRFSAANGLELAAPGLNNTTIGANVAASGAFTSISATTNIEANTYLYAGTYLYATNHIRGQKFIKQQTSPVNNSATSTMDHAAMTRGILTGAPAGAIDYTLPTGAVMDTFASTYVDLDDSFDFSIINTAGGTITVLQAASGFTIIGNAVVAANGSGWFRARKTAANTYVLYRLS